MAQVLLANLDHDYPYSNSLLLLGGVKQLGIKHLAQGHNTPALAGSNARPSDHEARSVPLVQGAIWDEIRKRDEEKNFHTNNI